MMHSSTTTYKRRLDVLYRWLTLVLLGGLGVVALVAADRAMRFEQKEEDTRRLERIARLVQSRLSTDLQIPLNTVASMQAFMLAGDQFPDFKRFDQFAARMLRHTPAVHGFAYVDQNRIIRHFYPLAGNKEAIGLDLSTRPAAQYVESAIRNKTMTISPPTVTVQGPLATIARMPLYRGEQFLGLVQAVIGIEQALQMVIKDLEGDVQITLQDSNGVRFWGQPEYPQEAKLLKVKVGESVWHARVWLGMEDEGMDESMILVVWLGGIALLLSLLFIVNRSFTQGSLLAVAVQNKTAQLAASENRLRSLIEQVKLVGIGLDRDGLVNYVNPYFCEVTGYSKDEVIGTDWFGKFLPSKNFEEVHAIYEKLHKGEIVSRYLNSIKTKSGEEREISWFNSRLVDENGRFDGTFSIGEDITSKHELEKRLDYLAYHDTLTGLPNRTLFIDRLKHAVKRVQRDNSLLALMIIDLDQFKNINDSLGHFAGDMLLRAAGQRLQNIIRSADTVARLGGDEFTVLLENVKQIDVVEEIANKILAGVSEPFEVDMNRLYISASIGIVLYPISDKKADDLLRAADTAMYYAKAAGRNCYRFYEAAMADTANKQLSIANSLHDAILHGELSTVFQPIINLASNEMTGLEILLRWKHAERGWISPADFIPIAESTGLIVPIGYWVLREACRFSKLLKAESKTDVTISVNVSGYQFRDRDFLKKFTTILKDEQVSPKDLVVEITETQLMEDARNALEALQEIRDMGCRIAIDDFGTGYSSLSYLKLFPVDVLKIDRSFIADLVIDQDSLAFLEAIQLISMSLDIKLVAEGVETGEQLSILKSMNIEMAQGYYLGRPCVFTELFKRDESGSDL